MSAPSWLAGLPISIGLHLIAAVTAVIVLRAEHAPTVLVVDLSAIVADRDDGAARRSDTSATDAPSASVPTPARGGRRSSERGAERRMASQTSPALSEAARVPVPAAPAPSQPAPEVPPPPSPPTPPPAARLPEVPAPQPEQSAVASREVPPSPAGAATGPVPPAIAPSTGRSTASARESGTAGGDAAAGGAAGAASGRGSGTGQETGGGSGAGAGDRVAAIEPGSGSGLGSDYAGYLSGVRQRIHETLRYPPAARRRGVSGTVQLEIGIQPDGSIGTVTIVASSSHDVLDRAAVDAARALPRMPFPGDVRPRALTVRLPVVFELQ